MRRLLHIVIFGLFLSGTGLLLAQTPVNDDCANASLISISGGGWDYGSFVSDTVDLSTSTIQAGEYVHPAQVARDRSVWYKFSIPTTRSVRIILRQPGPPYSMATTDAGWTLFSTQNCLPGAVDVVDPPILNIEGYTHECLKAGEYLIQVTGQLFSSGPVYLELQVTGSTANETDYDYSAAPYNFGVVSGNTLLPPSLDHYYEFGCQSVYDTEVLCQDSTYTQSTWHVFTTDAHVDYVRFEITETPWDPLLLTPRTWGYRLYEGNAILDSVPDNGPGLTTIDSCRTLTVSSNGQYATTFYPCELQPNTTYSIHLSVPTEYFGRVNVRMYEMGGDSTASPNPNSIAPAHQLGTLAYNLNYNVTDWFACNGVLGNNLCGTVSPDTVWHNGQPYDLNRWLTFTLPQPANIDMDLFELACMPNPLIRIFRGDVTTNCNIPLDTTFYNGLYYRCMDAGTWSVQILGQMNPPQGHTCYSNIGKQTTFRVRVDQVAPMQFGLFTPQEIDTINGGVALTSGTQYYSTQDYFECRTTVLPDGPLCTATDDRAIYRLIYVNANGILTVGGGVWYRFRYRLYRGDASSLPIVGNRIQGLVDQVGCQSLYWPAKVCVTPGWYTLVTLGDVADVGYGDRPWTRFEAFPPTLFTNPAAPEALDTLGNANGTVVATPTRFNCDDNPLTILGYAPCNNATKQVYRQFYLDSPQLVTFTDNSAAYQTVGSGIRHRIFRGRISNSTLTALERDCFSSFTECMQPGWYTVVSYGYGNTFATPPYTSGYGASIGDLTGFTLSINPSLQQFGTFATAEQVNGGLPIFWEPDYPGGHTAQIPRNHKTYTLGTEYWVCADNLPFPAGITPCVASHNRVSYRVFTLSKPSHVMIEGLNPWPYNHQSRVYQGDITGQTPPFTAIQECMTDDIRLCLSPGTYTLVTFAGDQNIGRTMTPVIYLDSLGVSKFDHAQNAYEFGNIPNTGTEYRGNPVDPPGPFGRAPSNDFFFCTTTAQASDPRNVCPIGQDPPAPSLPSPWNPRQNLWYTFTVTGPGQVDVAVYNLTQGKANRSPFAIYKGPNAIIPPADSTFAQGLTLINRSTTWYCGNYQSIGFYRDPCTAISTDRYYVLVDRNAYTTSNYYEPNTQLEVGVTFTPAPAAFVLYDHYSQANPINGNPTLQCTPPYTTDTLTSGTFTGCQGNLNCATQDPTDQNSCGTHTIWYTFVVDHTGLLRLNYDRPGGVTTYDPDDIQLYREVVPGDSSAGGLVQVPLSTVNMVNADFDSVNAYNWGQGCMEPGRYYIIFTGCNYPTETVVPRIWLTPQSGDLCSDPITMVVDTAGVFTSSLVVNCLTIGEAPGEDGTNMGCLDGPVGFKSAWFNISITDTTTKYNIDVNFDEFTNVTGDKIKYRVGYGDCNYMTFDNCVADGIYITLNMQCREAGTFWIQVTMPDYTTDSLQLELTATPVSDTSCIPLDPNRPRANFTTIASCSDVPVVFQNTSTTGPGVSYLWDFGDGYGSTLQNPLHTYAVADTYLVSLIVDNGLLQDTLYRNVIVYDRPGANFTMGPPPSNFVGDSIYFTNISTGTLPSATYFWDFCQGAAPCGASLTSYVGPNPPPVVYSTAGRKVICLTVLNGNCDSTVCYELFINDTTIFAGGPYDGHSVGALASGCVQTEQNVFAGGPYDGHSVGTLNGNCSRILVNVYAGGPYDGHAHDELIGNCPSASPNIYAGGPYDGHDSEYLSDSCPIPAVNIYAGGPYDGQDVAELLSNCPPTQANIFAGGPYDGHDVILMFCDTLFVPPPDSNSCDTCSYAGGPYDGAAVAELWAGCPITQQNVFAGGPYDGHDVAELLSNCAVAGPAIYAGGPYDGADVAFLTDSCSRFVVNVFSGGPYDGHDDAYLTDSCSRFVINIFAGGPYDGHDDEQRVPNSNQPFTAVGDTVCIGTAATLTATAPSNWFTYSNGGYVFQGGTSSTFTTPIFYSPGIYDFWVDNPYNCEKLLIQAVVLDTLALPDFVFNPACPGDTTFFTNQSVVPGPPQISFGGSGFPILGMGPNGIPPSTGLMSFSSAQYRDFAMLSNGVNDQQFAWTANNSGPSTEWVQWNYLTPKSVNRFYYWPRNSCCPDKGPTALRLYYDDGGGWVQVKNWTPPYPSNSNFDSGFFFETANVYAKRWKLEADVVVANAPSWGEFQVFASDPMVGGTTYWDFGDGFTSTQPDPGHIYGASGTYNVTLTVDVPAVLCVNSIVQPVVINGCGPLPLFRNYLSGRHNGDRGVNDLRWEVDGTFETAWWQKLADGNWADIGETDSDSSTYYLFEDPDVLYGQSNLYRVRAMDRNGLEQMSNVVEIFVERPLEKEITLFPNPTMEKQGHLLLKLPEAARVKVEIWDMFGKRIAQVPQVQFERGVHQMDFNIHGLAGSTYFVRIQVNGEVFVKKLVVM